MHILENDMLKVSIGSKGAEIKSIRRTDDSDDIEYLWQLDPKIWERQAPLLFPFIGRLKDGEYLFNGKKYKTDIHGFARFMEFETIERSESHLSLRLRNNKRTEAEYPFSFELTINYSLDDMGLVKEHVIENKGNSEMLYEIGGHEGYNLALFEGERMEDYYIDFDDMDHIETFTVDEDKMIKQGKKRIELEGGRLFLSPEVFRNDALIMDNLSNRKVVLGNIRNDRRVIVEFNDFKYLGIWSKFMRGNYVCIEPWSSLPDCSYLGKELSGKVDIRRLRPGEKERLSYKIGIV